MDELKRQLLRHAEIGDDDIIRVDMFLNHCIDTALMQDMGTALAKAFKGEKITKVLTVESSGIALACFTALALGVPAVYAKKYHTGYIDPDVYSEKVHSFSMEKSYTLRVSRRYLHENDRILLVDDILASGQAMLGLLEIISRAGAEAAGVGVAIEKAGKDGGQVLRQMGLRVAALATIQGVADGQLVLADD